VTNSAASATLTIPGNTAAAGYRLKASLGAIGGKASANNLSEPARKKRAKKAAAARWGKKKEK
jgi:hypothetical protein